MVCSDVKNDCVQDRDQVGLIRDKHRFGGHLILKATLLQTLTKIKEELESSIITFKQDMCSLIVKVKHYRCAGGRSSQVLQSWSGFLSRFVFIAEQTTDRLTGCLGPHKRTEEQGKSRIF